MFKLVLPAKEVFDETQNRFVQFREQVLQLEHSLISVSKWEANWEQSFLDEKSLTVEQTVDYVKCMTINPNVNPEVYSRLTNEDLDKVEQYIERKMTATTFGKLPNENPGAKHKIVTSEIIYQWMIRYHIPFECQKWHLNRLLTLIQVCNLETQPQKKMSRKEIYAQNRAINNQRRAKYKTRG